MIRRLALAGLIALFPALASAQFATIGATPPTSDNGDRLATTAWVNNLITSGLPLASGKIWIGSAGNIATAQTPSGDCTLSLSGVITCTQAAGNFNVIGILSVGGGVLQTNIVAPSTPAAGKTQVYVDSTTKTLTAKNDAGTVSNTVVPLSCSASQWARQISSGGVITCSQPNFTDLAGSASCAQEPALTGGVTSSAGSCATTVVTNANLTGPVTSVGNATAIANNQITRAMEAQGIARSVIGVTGNATANVADIQGTANQALVVNAGGTALSFGAVNLAAAAAVTNTLPVANGGTNYTGGAFSTYTPTLGCGAGTLTSAAATGHSLTIGKLVIYNIDIIVTTNGTCATNLTATMPSNAGFRSAATGRNNNTGRVVLGTISAAANVFAMTLDAGTYPAADGQSITINGSYESQ